jgi:hypothetical protein
MANEIAILEPRGGPITPERRAAAMRYIEEIRAKRRGGDLALVAVGDGSSDGTAETIAAAVGATIDSSLQRVTGYGGNLETECTVEHRSADGAVTVAKLKFRYEGRR